METMHCAYLDCCLVNLPSLLRQGDDGAVRFDTFPFRFRVHPDYNPPAYTSPNVSIHHKNNGPCASHLSFNATHSSVMTSLPATIWLRPPNKAIKESTAVPKVIPGVVWGL